MEKRIKGLIMIVCSFALLSGCDATEELNTIDLISPTPTPAVSVSGEQCEFSTDQIFSQNGKAVYSECEIRKNAKLFNGKTIRISSKYGFMIHGSYLASDNCDLSGSIDEAISVGMSEKDWKYLESLRGRKSNLVDITAVGTFSVTKPTWKTDTIYDRTPYHFSITCLEKATADSAKQ